MGWRVGVPFEISDTNPNPKVFQLMVSVKSRDGDHHFWEIAKRFRDCFDFYDQVQS